MQKIQCELCGSNDIIKKDGLFVCENCGTKYSLESARELFNNLSINIEGQPSENSLLKRALQFKTEGNFTKAYEYFNKVLDINPDNEIAQEYLNNNTIIDGLLFPNDALEAIDCALKDGNRLEAVRIIREITGIELNPALALANKRKDFIC